MSVFIKDINIFQILIKLLLIMNIKPRSHSFIEYYEVALRLVNPHFIQI